MNAGLQNFVQVVALKCRMLSNPKGAYYTTTVV